MTDAKTIIKDWCAAAGMPEPSDGECHALEVALQQPSGNAGELPSAQDREDADLLDWLREETCDLRCINEPTGGDDYDVRWIVIRHHMAKPHEREIGRSFTDDPRDAIRAARAAKGE